MGGIFGGSPGHDYVLAILGLLGLIVTGWASIRVAKIASGTNRRAAQDTNTLSWAQQMSSRLEKVEAKVTELEGKLNLADRVITALGGYVDALLWWIKTGQTTPMPRPPVIVHDHIDPNMLDLDPPTAHDGAPSVTPQA